MQTRLVIVLFEVDKISTLVGKRYRMRRSSALLDVYPENFSG